jgi:hypothetical protein
VATNNQTREQQQEEKTHHRKKPEALILCEKIHGPIDTLKRRIERGGETMAYKVPK